MLEVRNENSASVERKNVPEVGTLTKALALCSMECSTPDGHCPCDACYLRDQSDADGRLPTGEHCFTRLAADAIQALEQLNTFQGSELERLLGKVAEQRQTIEVLVASLRSALTDGEGLTDALRDVVVPFARSRLIVSDPLGNWCLPGVAWETVPPKVYGALCKLKAMEDAVQGVVSKLDTKGAGK